MRECVYVCVCVFMCVCVCANGMFSKQHCVASPVGTGNMATTEAHTQHITSVDDLVYISEIFETLEDL